MYVCMHARVYVCVCVCLYFFRQADRLVGRSVGLSVCLSP